MSAIASCIKDTGGIKPDSVPSRIFHTVGWDHRTLLFTQAAVRETLVPRSDEICQHDLGDKWDEHREHQEVVGGQMPYSGLLNDPNVDPPENDANADPHVGEGFGREIGHDGGSRNDQGHTIVSSLLRLRVSPCRDAQFDPHDSNQAEVHAADTMSGG